MNELARHLKGELEVTGRDFALFVFDPPGPTRQMLYCSSVNRDQMLLLLSEFIHRTGN